MAFFTKSHTVPALAAPALGSVLAGLLAAAPGWAASESSRIKAPEPPKIQSRSFPRSFRAPAAKEIRLTLPESVYLGLRTNRSIRSAFIERTAQRFDLRVAEDQFTPKLSISSSAQRSVTGGLGTNEIEFAPAVSWQTPTGAVIGFFWLNNTLRASDGSQSQSTGANLSLVQPLLRGAGNEIALAPLRTARFQETINQLRLRNTVSETVGQIILQHRDLIRLQEQRKLAQSALQRARALIDISKALIENGKLAKMEIVQVEADVAAQEVELIEIGNQVDAARLRLLTQLAVDLLSPVVATERLDVKRVAIDLNKVIETAYYRRSDYNIQKLVVEQLKLGILVAENEKLWDLSLFANAALGVGETKISGSLPRRQKVRDLTFGVRFSAPINDLAPEQNAKRANVNLATAQIALSALRQGVEGQVRGAVRDVEARWRQLELAKTSLALAARTLEIETEKFRVGRSSNFQVLTFESRLRDAENAQLNATIAYLNTLTLLDLQLGTTLDTWRINLVQ